MPSAKHLALLRDTVRKHPVFVASTAATAGVLLGGFVAVQLLAPPHKAQADGATPPQVTADAKPAQKSPSQRSVPKPVAETTGSAASGDRVAAADCDQQTWPYLSRDCVRRGPRVISTDKLHPPTVTAVEPQPRAPAAAPDSVTPVPPAPASPSPSVVSTAAAATNVAHPETKPEAKVETESVGKIEMKPVVDAKAEHKSKRHTKKSARKSMPAADQDDEADRAVAHNDADDESFGDGRADRRAERRPGRARIVDRWTERDYDVDSEDGGRRRVTVIRRNRSGGVFENLFGMGRNRDDDD